jgi:mannose-1-phosphate guanylyltransferase
LIIVSQLDALWTLGRQHFPETTALLEHAAKAFDTEREDAALQEAYQKMPSWNLSADLFSGSAANLAVMEMDGVQWSDWGKPERILDTLNRMGWDNDQPSHPSRDQQPTVSQEEETIESHATRISMVSCLGR